MWPAITFFIALPLLWTILKFYWQVGYWVAVMLVAGLACLPFVPGARDRAIKEQQ